MNKIGLKFLHLLDPEMAHLIAIKVLTLNNKNKFRFQSELLKTSIAGFELPHPLGISAGFDKNAEVIHAAFNYGASFTEVGAVTPLPQKGNKKPRVFRLREDMGLINRLGFNNHGIEIIASRLKMRQSSGVVGVNIGANKDSPNMIEDYLKVMDKIHKYVDFATINISSPNTPHLRKLQNSDALKNLLSAATDKNNSFSTPIKIFLKIDPDLSTRQLASVTEIALQFNLDGLIATNTSVSRQNITSKHKYESGGISGRPLFSLSTKKLAQIFDISCGTIPIIGVGGINSAADAYTKIKAGATALQIYTALGYHGMGVIKEIVTELNCLLKNDGISNISSAIGIENKNWL